MPENSKPAFYEPFPHAHDQISCIEKDPLVFSKSQIFFSFLLKWKWILEVLNSWGVSALVANSISLTTE